MMHLNILIDSPITHVTNLLDILIPSHPTWRYLLPSFLFYLFTFCHILYPDCSFPSIYPSKPLSLFPRSTPLFPFKNNNNKKTCVPWVPMEHGISSSKIRPGTNLHVKAGWVNEVEWKRSQEGAKEMETIPIFLLLGIPHEQQVTQIQCCVCVGPTESYRVYVCHFILCEPQWTLVSWFCGECSPAVLHSSGSYNPSVHSSSWYPKLHIMLGDGSPDLLPSIAEWSLCGNNWVGL